MLKEKISNKQKIAAVVLVVLAISAVGFFLFEDAFMRMKMSRKGDETQMIPVVQISSSEALSSAAPVKKVKPKITRKTKVYAARSSSKEVSSSSKKKESNQVIIRRIEKTISLKKPKVPEETKTFVPLVYSSMRQIAQLGDLHKALKWCEEGMYFTDDASFYSFGALLHLRLERFEEAELFAQGALQRQKILDRDSHKLAKAVQALVKNPSETWATQMIRRYKI